MVIPVIDLTHLNKSIGKRLKVFLSFPNGAVIKYCGELIDVNTDSLLLDDWKLGAVLITKKDIIQILFADNRKSNGGQQ